MRGTDCMRRLLCVWVGIIFLAGCATVPGDVQSVWRGQSLPPMDWPALVGFRVTPRQAYDAVFEERALPLDHTWHIYADSHDYYVHDTFFGDSTYRAFTEGVRVDGQTGKIVKRARK